MSNRNLQRRPNQGGVTRRQFLKWIGAAGVSTGLTSVGGAAYAFGLEPKAVVTERVTITLARLPLPFEGFLIAQLSDLHFGPLVTEEHIEAAITAVNQAKPDVVVVTGDLVSALWKYMQPCLQMLSRLVAPHGVYVVLGNHDHWVGYINKTVAAAKRVGLNLLLNQTVPLTLAKSQLLLVGLDDWWVEMTNFQVALKGFSREACKIALIHEPDTADYAAEAGIDLQLSGHSHGGQVRIPAIGPLILPRFGRKYPAGLARVGESTQVYTNRGIGVLAPAVRFNCPPEVTLIRLTRQPAQGEESAGIN